jgi:hypothetical protein
MGVGMSVQVLALDLEGTLIYTSMYPDPRPGLFDFLEFCLRRFERVTLFTCVEEADAREILDQLARSGHVPAEFPGRVEYVEWAGEYKDLSLIPGATPEEVLLVDDDHRWVRPDQRHRYVAITAWEGGEDGGLREAQVTLVDRLG